MRTRAHCRSVLRVFIPYSVERVAMAEPLTSPAMHVLLLFPLNTVSGICASGGSGFERRVVFCVCAVAARQRASDRERATESGHFQSAKSLIIIVIKRAFIGE